MLNKYYVKIIVHIIMNLFELIWQCVFLTNLFKDKYHLYWPMLLFLMIQMTYHLISMAT